jgi:hypothetical protein
MPYRSLVLAGTLAAAGVLIAACSSSPSPSAGSSSSTTASSTTTTAVSTTTAASPTVASLEATVRAYSAAFLGGDGAGAWALLSTRCQEKMAEIDYKATVAAAGVKYGSATLQSVTGTVNGAEGSATYTYSDPTIDQHDQPWTFESGGWRWDAC